MWGQRTLWRKEDPSPDRLKALYVYEILAEQEADRPHPAPLNPFLRWKPKEPT